MTAKKSVNRTDVSEYTPRRTGVKQHLSYLSLAWQWAVIIHLPLAFHLWPRSQKGLFCRGEGILGLWGLLFRLLATCLGGRSSPSLWCHGPGWQPCTETCHLCHLGMMPGQAQTCLHWPAYPSPLWLYMNTNEWLPHACTYWVITSQLLYTAINNSISPLCNSSFDVFWKKAAREPPPFPVYSTDDLNFPQLRTHLSTLNSVGQAGGEESRRADRQTDRQGLLAAEAVTGLAEGSCLSQITEKFSSTL